MGRGWQGFTSLGKVNEGAGGTTMAQSLCLLFLPVFRMCVGTRRAFSVFVGKPGSPVGGPQFGCHSEPLETSSPSFQGRD